jgi:plastocyanin
MSDPSSHMGVAVKRVAAVVAIALTVGSASSSAAIGNQAREARGPVTSNGPVPLPDHGSLFGAFVELDFHNGTERQQAWTDFEAKTGRTMTLDREYYLWNEPWPTADDEWSRDQGRTLFFSWKAALGDRSCIYWADIANGLHDAEIDAQAAKIIAFGAPIFFAFNHEPTTVHTFEACGTASDFVNAWKHIRNRFIADGVTNVTYAWTMTAWSFLQNNAAAYYPGNAAVDVMAADGYNWFGCTFHRGPWREPEEIFVDWHDFGVSRGKPMIIAEYGTGEDPDIPGRKAQWFANFGDLMKQWPDIKGVSYYNNGNGSCDRWVDTSDTSLDAFSQMGADPWFNPPMTPAPVSVADFSFTPSAIALGQGGLVEWSFVGPSDHTTTDATGLALYDSGPLSPGATFDYTFLSAGNYKFQCSIHPQAMRGIVRIPMTVEPSSGTIDTTFTLTWGAEWAPTGKSFQVQIHRPGIRGWATFMDQGDNQVDWIPDGGVGTYQFRVRYEDQVSGATSGWSAPVNVVVS